jgi:NTP pyrophosphatase (non-canonical NTP hydrolase)
MSDPKYKHIGHIEDKLVEELSELIKAIMKARRFGYFDYHPNTPDISNLQKIMMEIEDVTDRMEEYWDFLLEKYNGENEQKGVKGQDNNRDTRKTKGNLIEIFPKRTT